MGRSLYKCFVEIYSHSRYRQSGWYSMIGIKYMCVVIQYAREDVPRYSFPKTKGGL
ncbi:hypothetical protein FA13DRAFT_617505 [Coprinellus micaceus]|uniref:Uncharacterized protein n=1 Tax=Coprinellus micaceus TaxID=71717 RepID=A0A4Y7SKK1_COPMI|nr:hypothetical protein FA13DRAFT_94169 [Coprinellus micaceus]TEB29595.1 hypothetical protein FA13DRAFT_617505 [Coprinellus micaceus]